MKVKLLEEWMGHKKDTILDLIPSFAATLVGRKQGEKVEEDTDKKGKKEKVDKPPVEKLDGEKETSEKVSGAEEKNLDDSKVHTTELKEGKIRNKILKRRR